MTEVEEGFVSTAVEHELANPKLYGKVGKDTFLFSIVLVRGCCSERIYKSRDILVHYDG